MRRSFLLGPLIAIAIAIAVPATAATGAPAVPVEAPHEVTAVLETPPRFDDDRGGNADADDPAVWVHPDDGELSVVLGALKNGGLEVYDLDGAMLQHIDTPPPPDEGLEAGRFNNVDLLQGVDVDGLPTDLAVVTDRGRDRLRIYAIDPAGAGATGGLVLRDVTVEDAPRLFSRTEPEVEAQNTGYGLALRVDESGDVWAAVSRRHRTTIGLFQLAAAGDGAVTYHPGGRVRLPKRFELPDGTSWTPCEEPGEDPQIEGMVIDRRNPVLFAAQEDIGIWRIPIKEDGFGRARLLERTREYGVPATYDAETEECVPDGEDPGFGGDHLSADAEGLSIAYPQGQEAATLIASSQGDSTFSIFAVDRSKQRLPWLHTFAVGDSSATDSVEHSDGAQVITSAVGSSFPGGLLVVHDGENTRPSGLDSAEARPSTNFKFVRWDDVLAR